jgi:hypothetical protein
MTASLGPVALAAGQQLLASAAILVVIDAHTSAVLLTGQRHLYTFLGHAITYEKDKRCEEPRPHRDERPPHGRDHETPRTD